MRLSSSATFCERIVICVLMRSGSAAAPLVVGVPISPNTVSASPSLFAWRKFSNSAPRCSTPSPLRYSSLVRNPGCIGKPGAFANDGGSLSHASYAARSAPPGPHVNDLAEFAFGNIPAQHVLHVITPVRVVLSRACRGLLGNRLILTRVKTLTVVLPFAGSVFDVDSFGDAFIALLSRAVIERDRLVCCGGIRRWRSRRRSIWRRRVRRDIFACRW